MNRLKRNASTLKLLHGAKKSSQNMVLEHAKNDLIECICNIFLNVLKGTAPISRQYKKQLIKHKNFIVQAC